MREGNSRHREGGVGGGAAHYRVQNGRTHTVQVTGMLLDRALCLHRACCSVSRQPCAGCRTPAEDMIKAKSNRRHSEWWSHLKPSPGDSRSVFVIMWESRSLLCPDTTCCTGAMRDWWLVSLFLELHSSLGVSLFCKRTLTELSKATFRLCGPNGLT